MIFRFSILSLYFCSIMNPTKFLIAISLLAFAHSLSFAEKKEIQVTEKRHGNHSEISAPPTVTYDDDNGTVKITTDSAQVGSIITVTNESGEAELQASTYSTKSVFPLFPIDGETLTISIVTTSGNTYEGAIN